MIDVSSDGVAATEIHAQRDAWITIALAVPVRHIDGVAKKGFVHWFAILGGEQEMDLVYMESVHFA